VHDLPPGVGGAGNRINRGADEQAHRVLQAFFYCTF
jgi:hypothetical protein